jgi:Lon protease-like protein
MSKGTFIASFADLPASMPIFPLPDAVLMPHAELPLNIFEPRYLNMVNDVLGSHRSPMKMPAVTRQFARWVAPVASPSSERPETAATRWC